MSQQFVPLAYVKLAVHDTGISQVDFWRFDLSFFEIFMPG